MVQHRAILTIADHQKVVYDLSNGTIFNDLERPLPPVSRSLHSLTLNISEMVRDTDSFILDSEATAQCELILTVSTRNILTYLLTNLLYPKTKVHK